MSAHCAGAGADTGVRWRSGFASPAARTAIWSGHILLSAVALVFLLLMLEEHELKELPRPCGRRSRKLKTERWRNARGHWGNIRALRGFGLRADSSWFFHVSYAVYLTVRRPDRAMLAERWLYPAVAQHYHTGSLDIKRSICFAVDLIWKTDRRTLRAITRCPLERAASHGVRRPSCRLLCGRQCRMI